MANVRGFLVGQGDKGDRGYACKGWDEQPSKGSIWSNQDPCSKKTKEKKPSPHGGYVHGVSGPNPTVKLSVSIGLPPTRAKHHSGKRLLIMV